mgnify:CR=1 FL=1
MEPEGQTFYVYILYDERTKLPFYVGKGQGYRIDQHETEDDPNVEKRELITSFKTAGCLGKRVIGRFATEEEAYAVEAVLIKWIYGLRNLTNRCHGKRHELIRNVGDFELLPSIDVERNVTVRDGSYTEQQLVKLRGNNVVEKLEYLSHLAASILADLQLEEVNISDVDIKFPQDPQIRLNHPNWPCNLRLKVQLTGASIAPAFTARSGKEQDRGTLQQFAERLNQVVKKGTPHFIGLWQIDGNTSKGISPSCPSIDDEREIENCIRRMLNILCQQNSGGIAG